VGIGGTFAATRFFVTDTQANFGTRYLQRNAFNTSATVSGNNKALTFDMDATNMTIPAGVTDSGYRLAIRSLAYANTAGFAGTHVPFRGGPDLEALAARLFGRRIGRRAVRHADLS